MSVSINSGNNFASVYSAASSAKSSGVNKKENVGQTDSVSFSDMISRGSVDSISIDSNKTSDDGDFVKALSADISNDVKAGYSPAELGAVKQQIALGEYDINAADVARKILG